MVTAGENFRTFRDGCIKRRTEIRRFPQTETGENIWVRLLIGPTLEAVL
jgi:hypothetical protein